MILSFNIRLRIGTNGLPRRPKNFDGLGGGTEAHIVIDSLFTDHPRNRFAKHLHRGCSLP
jgi:hypothetical protein